MSLQLNSFAKHDSSGTVFGFWFFFSGGDISPFSELFCSLLLKGASRVTTDTDFRRQLHN